jgi:glycosyltransferase involved in cell wall biosynthesis
MTGPGAGRRALVATVVHHPQDARIRHREIAALLDAGWLVSYAAPFAGYPDSRGADVPGLTPIQLPRAAGRRRLAALRAARALLAAEGGRHDVILLHDPELLLALPGLRLPPVVWDVHEDTAAATSLKPWLPGPLRRPTRSLVAAVERVAERRVHLLLAEDAYAARFALEHPVISNTVIVPDDVLPPGDDRVIYIGHLTRARGAEAMVTMAYRLTQATSGAVATHLIGHADAATTELLRRAQDDGVLRWHGFLPTDAAQRYLGGALAGLSLLRDEPNYRVSMPTKVMEYLAHGVPVVTTPLPLAADLVRGNGGGVVVPFDDPTAAADAVLALREDPSGRAKMGRAGHLDAREHYDWRRLSRRFVAELARIAEADPRN